MAPNVYALFLSTLSLACSSQTSYLEAQKAMFTRHKTRLSVVRELKEKARLELLGKPLIVSLLTQVYRL